MLPRLTSTSASANEPEVALAPSQSAPLKSSRGLKGTAGLLAFVIVLVAAFVRPLYELVLYARHSELYSHILLIPFISLYLVWLKRRDLLTASEPARSWAALPLALGIVSVVIYWVNIRSGIKLSRDDYLAWMTGSSLCFFFGGCFLFLGTRILRTTWFPLLFLIFAVPFPDVVRNALESFLQHSSADAAYLLLRLSGMPVFRHGTEFQLPGFQMEVAPQCSGIHSSLVLFITSLLAGHLLLSRGWSRTLLGIMIVPLAIFRNGFRIFVLGQLCVRVNPDWINSDLHHRGGPIFFGLSLIPFFLLLLLLYKLERHNRGVNS